MINNRDQFRLWVLHLVRRFHLVEAATVIGVVTASVVGIAFMLEELLGSVRSKVQASMDIEANEDIQLTDQGGELALGQFKVVSTIQQQLRANSTNLISGQSDENKMLQVVEMDATAVVKSLDEHEIVRFHSRLKNYKYRIRELFDQTIRKSVREDFQDPKLASLRQRIRSGMNELLETNIVGDVIFSHFRTFRLPVSMYSYQPEMFPKNELFTTHPSVKLPHTRVAGVEIQTQKKQAGILRCRPVIFDLSLRMSGYREEFASRSASFLKYSSTA